MKAVVKPEHAWEKHPDLGTLIPGVVYEVESLGELFIPAPEEE